MGVPAAVFLGVKREVARGGGVRLWVGNTDFAVVCGEERREGREERAGREGATTGGIGIVQPSSFCGQRCG